MPIGIKEAKMGLYRAVEGGATYMALDADEWAAHLDLQKKYKKLLSENKKTVQDSNQKSEEIRKANQIIGKANEYIQIGQERDRLNGQLKQENQALKQENERLQKTVENMLRIQKERANTQRKLKPKKEHPGYIVLSQESTVRQIYSGVKNKYDIFQTVIQSPFDAGLKMDFVRKFFERDIYSFLADDMKIYSYCPQVEIYKMDDYIRSSNQIVFTVNFKQNYRSGYYDIVLCHNNEFEFPEYMRK